MNKQTNQRMNEQMDERTTELERKHIIIKKHLPRVMTSLLMSSTPISISHRLYRCRYSNRPFPSSKKSHFQNEAKCETFVVKMTFICIIIENHFHINGFALSLVMKVRFFGTRKWPIPESWFASSPSFSSSRPAARALRGACSQASVN